MLLTSFMYRLPDQKATVCSSLFAALYKGREGLALYLQDAVSSFSQAYLDIQRGKGRWQNSQSEDRMERGNHVLEM